MLRLPSLSIFRHRAYTLFLTGRVLVTFGMQMQLTAMTWQIYDAAREQGESIAEASFLLGLVGLAQFLPLLFLSLIGGSVADRFNRKFILMLCYLGKAAIGLSLFVASLTLDTGALGPVIFAAAAATGAINAFLPSANSALLPMLVPRSDLPQAIAWGSLGFQTGVIVGPALGGLLYAFGAQTPYAVAAATFMASIVLLWFTRAPKQVAVENAQTVRMIVEGLRFVWSNKIVLGAISLDLVVVLLAGAMALLPVFARDILHAGPSELGVLRSAMGAGAAAVALGLAAAPLRRHVGRWMFGATIVFGLATIVFAFSNNLWITAAALAIAGAVDMISVYVRQSLIQLATPDPMRGRVAAVSFVFISASNELGDFEAGLMARIFGPVIAVAIGGGAAVAASLGWIKLFPDLATADGFEPRQEEPAAKVSAALAEGEVRAP